MTSRPGWPVTVWPGGHHVPILEVQTVNACSAEHATSKVILSGAVIAPALGRCSRPAAGIAPPPPPTRPPDTPGRRAAPLPEGDRSGAFPAPARPPSRLPSAGGGGARPP